MNRLMPGDKGVLVMEMFPFRRPVLRQVARKTWRRFREFVWDAAPIILLGSMALGLLYETGWVWELGTVLEPIVEGWLLLPMVAGLTLVFAVLRKELALQLLLVFAAVEAGGAVASISSFMTTSQIVTYAIVNAHLHPLRGHDRRAGARAGLAAHGRHLRRHHRDRAARRRRRRARAAAVRLSRARRRGRPVAGDPRAAPRLPGDVDASSSGRGGSIRGEGPW